MDRFQKGDKVVCTAPHPKGEPGYQGRHGIVQGPRMQWFTFGYGMGTIHCYPVLFDGDDHPVGAMESELLPIGGTEYQAFMLSLKKPLPGKVKA